MQKILDDIKNSQQLTNEDIDAIYKYLFVAYDTMDEEEKMFWATILAEYDEEFLNDENLDDE